MPNDAHDEHAVYAPSSAHRWANCTASATAIAALGEKESGEEADEGTDAHSEVERVLGHMNGLKSDARFAHPPINFDHPAAYGIALVVSYVGQLPPGILWIEQRVTLTAEIWGRPDVAHWHEESATLTIVDYKNGFVNVEAEENEQLSIYAASIILNRKLPAKWIRLVIVQPNSFMPVPRVKQWLTSAEALHARVSPWAAIPHGKLEFKAGEHCKYCPMFGQCPASRDVLMQLATMLANPADAVPAHQVATFMACKKPLADWFEGLEKANTKKALAGTVVPGMKVIQTIKHRAWKPEFIEPLKNSIHEAHGLKYFELPSPAQVEKAGIISPEYLANYSVKPDGGPALAFESDKRPTFKQKTAAEMFAAVTGNK